MFKFKVTYKYSRKVDLGIIEAKSIKEAEKKAEYQIEHNLLLRTEEDNEPHFIITKVEKGNQNEEDQEKNNESQSI